MDLEALDLILESLIYPGLVTTIFFIVFTQWIARKLSARIMYRRGPVYAGPAGFLQPLADLFKLVLKRDLVNRYSMGVSPVVLVSIATGFIVVAQLFLPVAYRPIYSSFDVIALLYFLLLAPFALAYLAAGHPNPYTTIGVARYLAILFVAEPAFAISVLVPVLIASQRFGTEYSIYGTSVVSHLLWAVDPFKTIAMILSAIAGFISMFAILGLKPFDAPEAESEIYWGMFTEVGGPRLALAFFMKFAERILFPMIYAALFLGGVWPTNSFNWFANALTVYLKTLIVFVATVVVDSILPRYRPDQAVSFILKYIYPMSIASLLLVIVK
ncbi:MAG: complex I subunit 1 family protein [Ignisphaera sp.]